MMCCIPLLQIQQLVIGKADFQQLFTARLTHQLSQLLQQHSTNNTDTIQIHATERTWYLLQYLYEFIITRLLNRINDTYVTPWLLVAFRLFPNSFRYVRNHPMNDAQRQELQHIYAMLPLAALQEQYDVGQGNQDLSAVHIARMTLAMELEGLF